MSSKNRTRHRPLAIPAKLGGKWIAFDHELTRIIASGRTLKAVRAATKKLGATDPIFYPVPRNDVFQIPSLWRV